MVGRRNNSKVRIAWRMQCSERTAFINSLLSRSVLFAFAPLARFPVVNWLTVLVADRSSCGCVTIVQKHMRQDQTRQYALLTAWLDRPIRLAVRCWRPGAACLAVTPQPPQHLVRR